MSGLVRAVVAPGEGLFSRARQGSNHLMPTIAFPGDAAVTLTMAQLLGGAIYGIVTAGRVYTVPTAALFDAALGNMDIGDTFCFWLVSTGGAVTLTGVSGVTVTGGLMVDGVGSLCICTKTAASTYTIHVF